MDYRSIMDGSRTDLSAIILRAGLSLAAYGYGAAVYMRNRRFDRNPHAIEDAGVPVISVGNITAGGTGKTPLVAAIAARFRANQIRVAIVSRGYGGDETGLNDEARELHDRLPDVPHIQDKDRVAACRIAVEELDMQVIILDDGFQHRRLKRDLELVVIDATCPFGYDRLLPRGLLREPPVNLRRADYLVLSRSNKIATQARQALIERLEKLSPGTPIVQCDHVPKGLLGTESGQSLEYLRNQDVAAFAGIGNPRPFFDSLPELGANLIATKSFPDHCKYGRETVGELIQWLEIHRRANPGLIAVCTHKDLVKLRTDQLAETPLWALEIDLEVQAGGVRFWNAIEQVAPAVDGISSIDQDGEPAI